MSFICHIHNYTEYNEEWNVFSAFNPSKCTHLEQWAANCAAPGEQSWTSCRSRDLNPQPWVTSGFKSNALSIRPTTALKLYRCLLARQHEPVPRTMRHPSGVNKQPEWARHTLCLISQGDGIHYPVCHQCVTLCLETAFPFCCPP